MKKQEVKLKLLGMNMDADVSAIDGYTSYKNNNIRFTTIDDSTTLAIVNEQGPKNVSLISEVHSGTSLNTLSIKKIIGQCYAGEKDSKHYWLIFAIITESLTDPVTHLSVYVDVSAIIRLCKTTDISFSYTILRKDISSNTYLSFSSSYPIECIPYMECENIYKVYWIDGLHQPRVINIFETSHTDSLDFHPDILNDSNVNVNILSNNVTVEKSLSGGYFHTGTIQYFIVYSYEYGQSSPILWQSDIQYITSDTAESPETSVTCKFTIRALFQNTNMTVDLYAVERHSENGDPIAYRVINKSYDTSGNNTYCVWLDTGDDRETIDYTYIQMLRGYDFTAEAMTSKQNTLFLGNYKDKTTYLSTLQKENLKTNIVIDTQGTKDITVNSDKANGSIYYSNYQLDKSQKDISYFKYKEAYRLGVQLQDKYGQWGEVIYVGDYFNNTYPTNTVAADGTTKLTVGTFKAYFQSEFSFDSKYINIRPVVVYPKLTRSNWIAEGVVNPTVFNIQDRINHAPDAQASWVWRFNAPKDNIQCDEFKFSKIIASATSQYLTNKIVLGDAHLYNADNDGTKQNLEFRHGTVLPDCSYKNAELQKTSYYLLNKTVGKDDDSDDDSALKKHILYDHTWIGINTTNDAYSNPEESYSNKFMIDSSIITMHSPEFEFNDDFLNIDISKAKCRIIGVVPVTANKTWLDINTEEPAYIFYGESGGMNQSFKQPMSYTNVNTLANLYTGAIVAWNDFLYDANQKLFYRNSEETEEKYGLKGYPIYMWQSTGSLSNMPAASGTSKHGILSKKTYINYHYSNNTIFNTDLYADVNASVPLTTTKIFGFDQDVEVVPLDTNCNYYGNVNTLISNPSFKHINDIQDTPVLHSDCASTYMPILTNRDTGSSANTYYNLRNEYNYKTIYTDPSIDSEANIQISESNFISMKYKTTKHAVLKLQQTVSGKWLGFPSLNYSELDTETSPVIAKGTTRGLLNTLLQDTSNYLPWDSDRTITNVGENKITHYPSELDGDYSFLWLTELYRGITDASECFNGTSEESLATERWMVAGDAVAINSCYDSTDISLIWSIGDTYYQRYDCLKTLPFGESDLNNIVDTLSFMCETRINLDGRYDKYRTADMTPYSTISNHNRLNRAYLQQDNFIYGKSHDSSKIDNQHFINSVMWSQSKVNGALLDKWTTISDSNFLDLDGAGGPISKLTTLSDNIFAFTPNKIYTVLFNERTMLTNMEGLPVEIANSNKVEGYKVLYDNTGAINKWAVCNTGTQIYYHDTNNKALMSLTTSGLKNISGTYGMASFFKSLSTSSLIWDCNDNNDAPILQYNRQNQELLFINKDNAFAFNESLEHFTSFYSLYNDAHFINTIDGISYIIQTDQIKAMYKGAFATDYFIDFRVIPTVVSQYGKATTYLADSIWDSVKYYGACFDMDNSESYISGASYTSIHAENEWQSGTLDLIYPEYKFGPANTLGNKFHTWIARIPRNGDNGTSLFGRDRMRNPWLRIKLSYDDSKTNYKQIIHSLNVVYYQ